MPAHTASWGPTQPMPCTAAAPSGTSACASSLACGGCWAPLLPPAAAAKRSSYTTNLQGREAQGQTDPGHSLMLIQGQRLLGVQRRSPAAALPHARCSPGQPAHLSAFLLGLSATARRGGRPGGSPTHTATA